MSYVVRRWWGEEMKDLPESEFGAVLKELEGADEEHGSVALRHESGWSLSYGLGRTLILEDVTSDAPAFHQHSVGASYVESMWKRLARGEISALKTESWRPGYE